MSENSRTPERPVSPEQLELFLDGQLTGEAANHVEAAIQENVAAQRVIAKQGQIDESLKRQFQPPAVSRSSWVELAEKAAAGQLTDSELDAATQPTSAELQLADQKQTAANGAEKTRQRRTLVLALAASIACIALWGSRWEQLSSIWQTPTGGYGTQTVAQIYQTSVDAGFKPDWFCEDEQRFAQTFEERQGQGLLLRPLPEGIRMAGLAYLNGFTPMTTCMLAHIDDEPVLVLVAKTERIEQSQLTESGDLAIFTRVIGELTLVEVQPASLSPSDAPRLLPHFYAAATPEEPTGKVPGSR